MAEFVGIKTFTDGANNVRFTKAYADWRIAQRPPATGGTVPTYSAIPSGYDPVKAAEQQQATQAQANATGVTVHGVAPVAAAPPEVAPPPPPPLTPEELFRSFMDGTYRGALTRATGAHRGALDPLQNRLNSLTETRQEYGGGTMYDQLLREAQQAFVQNRRGLNLQMNRTGLLRSGAHNREFGLMTAADLKNRSQLGKEYGAEAIGGLKTQIGSANAQLLEEKKIAALEAIGRAQANGVQISEASINAIMALLTQYGGQLPVGGN